MKIQNLFFNSLLVTITAMVAMNPVSSQSSESSKTSFFCQTKTGIPITVARTENGQTQPIFYWQSETLPTEIDVEQLCDHVSQELDNNISSDSKLASMGFKTIQLDKLPVICATNNSKDCNLVLFTLPPAERPLETANIVLASILNPELQNNRLVSNISNKRGVQSIYYKVNLWKLMGF